MAREMTEQDWMDFEEDMCVFVNMYEGMSYGDACDAARDEMKEMRVTPCDSERTRVTRRVRSNVEFSGAPQLHRGASAGTKG